MAGLTLSPQVALSVTAKPASIVLGVMSRIVAADAGVAGRTAAARRERSGSGDRDEPGCESDGASPDPTW